MDSPPPPSPPALGGGESAAGGAGKDTEALSQVDPFLVEALENPRHRLTVQRRISAIQAIRDAEIESLLSRLHLLLSCLSKEQKKTPALQFFRENMPNLSVVKKESDGIFELAWKNKPVDISMNHVTGKNVLASLDKDPTLPASCRGLEFSAQSFKINFMEAASLQIPSSGVEEPSEPQFLGSKDAFQTPGITSQRLSVGMTPKTLRLPKHGEMLLSVRGSPLGVYREENLEAIHESEDRSDGTSQEDS